MNLPFAPHIWGIKINVHLILEYLAFFIAFRYYLYLRRKKADLISDQNRLSIILGAIVGAFLGSRLMGFLENPTHLPTEQSFFHLLQLKSIMGGLFGGLLGVEIAKKLVGEKHSSGDLFTFPIILGIIIGRVGCFLSGTEEFTYGKETAFFLGMDLGDGLKRHPIALYEVLFLILLFAVLKRYLDFLKKEDGLLFKIFMMVYFGFRFLIEFIKPNIFLVFGFSSIQLLCLICWIYYFPTIKLLLRNAR